LALVRAIGSVASLMLQACVVCGTPSEQARCPAHRYQRDRRPRARRQRRRVIERDGFRCQECGCYLTGRRDTHVDHVEPLARRPGWRADHELQTLCAACNQAKADR